MNDSYETPLLVLVLVGSIVVALFIYASEQRSCKKFVKNNPIADIAEGVLVLPFFVALCLIAMSSIDAAEHKVNKVHVGMAVFMIALGVLHVIYIRQVRASEQPCADVSPGLHTFIKIEALIAIAASASFLIHIIVRSIHPQASKVVLKT